MKKVYSLLLFLLLGICTSMAQVHANEDFVNEFTDDMLRVKLSITPKLVLSINVDFSYTNRDLAMPNFLVYYPRTIYSDRFRLTTFLVDSEKPYIFKPLRK